MSIKIKGYFALLRPFTLLAPIIVSSSMMIACLMYSKRTDLDIGSIVLLIIPASFCFALLNGASNALNQATDYAEDKISKPYRPLPRAIVSQKEAYTSAFILYIVALFVSLMVHVLFSSLILVIAFFSITYSLPPRMKKMLFINHLWVAVPRGFCAVIASWSVFGDPFQMLPLVIGCIATLFLIGGTSTKDILDADADRAVGTKTLVNTFGMKKTALFSCFFMTIAFVIIIPLVFLQIIEFYVLPLSAFVGLGCIISWLMIHNHKNQSCENTSAWSLMYGTYFLFSICFSFLTIVYSV